MVNKPTEGRSAADLDHKLSQDDTFQFACGPHVPCFTECCGKLELLITPYDLLRLRTKLGVASGEFLDTHSTIRWKTSHGLPEVMMKMDPDSNKRCPFVTPEGCSVYADRPGACRIYPLGRGSTKHPMDGSRREFYFVVREDHCRGFEQTREWKVKEWLADQGMEEYNRVNDLLMEFYVLALRSRKIQIGPQHVQMFMMACYNLERFRDFVFKSAFLERFEIDANVVKAIREDDVKLLEFAFEWLKFALFAEPTISVQTTP
jgi:uncharacterized protein